MKIKSIKKIDYNETVYNLRIKSDNDKNHNYFANNINVSNCHKSKANSIKECIGKCVNSTRRFGLTGTIPKEGTLDYLTLNAYLGPKVIEIKSKELQDKGAISKVSICVVEINYPETTKSYFDDVYKSIDDRKTLLKMEQDYVIEQKNRLNVIAKIVESSEKNQLVLFHRQQYGKTLKRFLEENTSKTIYFIYGNTPEDERTAIFKLMKSGSNRVLIGSYGVCSTGNDVPALEVIHFAESFKSDVIIRQSIGRGLRLFKGKDKMRLFDYVDMLCTKRSNMLYYHGVARQKIYDEQSFPYLKKQIYLTV